MNMSRLDHDVLSELKEKMLERHHGEGQRMFTRKLAVTTEWIRLSDAPDYVSIVFRGIIEIGESVSVPDSLTPVLRLENEMVAISVDSLSWVRVPVDSRETVTVYILCS